MTNSKKDPQSREESLRKLSEVLGKNWVSAWIQRMLAEGRSVRGGWPGTLQEAKSQVRTHCDRELDLHGFPPLSQAELLVMASAVREQAKRGWLQIARERDAEGLHKP